MCYYECMIKTSKKKHRCSCCGDITDDVIIHAKRVDKLGRVKYYYYCNPCNTERMANYRKTKDGNKHVRDAVKKSMKKNKKEQYARLRLYQAIVRGKVRKPSLCENCGKNTDLQGHHIDYDRPLFVEWLCRKCHAIKHEK